jgi:hypothetical protein
VITFQISRRILYLISGGVLLLILLFFAYSLGRSAAPAEQPVALPTRGEAQTATEERATEGALVALTVGPETLSTEAPTATYSPTPGFLLASLAFGCPLNGRVNLAVEIDGPDEGEYVIGVDGSAFELCILVAGVPGSLFCNGPAPAKGAQAEVQICMGEDGLDCLDTMA